MKKITYKLLFLAVLTLGYSSCKDDKLDPLQTDSISKGKLLALRGTALTNVYVKGLPGAEVFPRIATAADKYVFEAEYLAEDPNSLQSVDFFVIKKTGSATERVLVKNVPFSDFKKDGKYPRPWVEVTLTLAEILPKLGLTATFPLSNGTITTLLSTYKFGVAIEGDLNLTDGTKATADKVVAAGLFQSDQFYPAQKLVYAVTDYCSYAASFWAGTFDSNEIDASGVYGPYNNVLTQDPSNPNKFTMDNFYDTGVSAYIILTPSTNPSTQLASFPAQQVTATRSILAGSTGTYDQCLGILNINLEYKIGSNVAPFRYNLKKQ